MAVQAHYPTNTGLFSPDFPRKAPRFNVRGLLLDDASASNQAANLLGVAATQPLLSQRQVVYGTTMFSGEPESELTCNVSGSRKRARDDSVAPTLPQLNLLQQRQQQQQLWLAGAMAKVNQGNLPAGAVGVSAGLHASHDSSRLNDSSVSSTSGRPPAGAPAPALISPATNPLVQDLVSQLYSQSHEIDALVRLQNEKLRSGLEEARKRHCRTLLSAMEQAVIRRLREKEAELESVSRRNAELEERIRQIAAENQVWFNVARNNEAIVSSLRASLEQVLQNANIAGGGTVPPAATMPQDVEEGYGDSDCVAPAYPAEDAQSCCYEGAADVDKSDSPKKSRERRVCKVCMQQEVSVLLLPCRHLCLCKQCEARLDACPVCNAVKNASLQIFMS
ncbi:hypothetical protein Taro_014817 [Colocasia esculenta]|uniref:RING-type domain-containing protein n=1 Tax=Colocasia esculenta TaxID=4460 RepID=A0A843UMZ2_COLES|nr:hypothetical protein [Colocasia esculenta]